MQTQLEFFMDILMYRKLRQCEKNINCLVSCAFILEKCCVTITFGLFFCCLFSLDFSGFAPSSWGPTEAQDYHIPKECSQWGQIKRGYGHFLEIFSSNFTLLIVETARKYYAYSKDFKHQEDLQVCQKCHTIWRKVLMFKYK